MRRCLFVVSAAVVAAMAVPAGAEGAHRCAVSDSKTVAGTSKVRVYWKDSVLFGCIRESGLKRKLYETTFVPNEYSSVELVRIAGHRVAFVITGICTVCSDGGPDSSLHASNLDTGELRVLAPVRRRPKGSYMGRRVDALVLDRCGRIAYRAVLSHRWSDDALDPELHTWVGGKRRRVDRGAIVRRSIRLERTSLLWTRGDDERSTPLQPPC